MKELLVLDLASELSSGESLASLVCPFCNGGSSGDKSFSVKREDYHVLYICHRASCGAQGRVSTRSVAAKSHLRKNRVWAVPSQIEPEHEQFIRRRYNLNDEEYRRADIGWVSSYSPFPKGRAYIPINNYLGQTRGFVARDLYGEQSPKALTMLFRPEDGKSGWYYRSRKDIVVVVEDCFSAIRLSSYCTSVFLNGTTISEVDVRDLRTIPHGNIYLCLDRDATRSAIKQALALRGSVNITVVPLEKDIKDMTPPELELFMEEKIYARENPDIPLRGEE